MGTETAFLRAWLSLGVGATGCAAQATDAYQGDALLELHGQASVNTLTGGLPVKPALCFWRTDLAPEPVHRSQLPPEVADRFSPQVLWSGASMAIVEVDSRGEFPSEFDVAVYVPPPADVIRPLFVGEPAAARGSVCAVRAGHPDTVSEPLRELQDCDPAPGERCIKRMLWASRDTQRYYIEQFDCPTAGSPKEDCTLSAEGDPQLAREDLDFVVGRDAMQVLYLAEPAPTYSYLAWHYGANARLAAGYHLFTSGEPEETALLDLVCRSTANSRALSKARERFEEHFVYFEEQDTTFIDPEYAAPFEDARQRLYAQYHRESCERPRTHEVSPDESLRIEINRDSSLSRVLFE